MKKKQQKKKKREVFIVCVQEPDLLSGKKHQFARGGRERRSPVADEPLKEAFMFED